MRITTKGLIEVYQKLFTSVDDTMAIKELLKKVNKTVYESAPAEVILVTPSIVLEAIKQVKNDKNDPSFAFNLFQTRASFTVPTSIV